MGVFLKEQFIKDLTEGEIVSSTFLVKNITKQYKKDQSPYLSLVLVDKTGEIDAKLWDHVERYEALFKQKDFIKVKGRINSYRQKLQIQLQDIYRQPPEVIDIADYLPVSPHDSEEQLTKLLAILEKITNPHLKTLVKELFSDKNFKSSFMRAPAAKQIHHAYCGGLLDHSLSMCQLAILVADHYPFLDKDLLIFGALVHDIGKIRELEYQTTFEYTDQGRLVGHLVQGCSVIEEKIRKIKDFPQQLTSLLQHYILSHHGQREYGAQQLPQTAEAMALHCIDLLDSKMETLRLLIEDLKVSGEKWTPFQRIFERSFYYQSLQNENNAENKETSNSPNAEKSKHPQLF